MLKTELVASKLVTAISHFPPSARLFGGEQTEVPDCLFSLSSKVSCAFGFVCSIDVSVSFCHLKVTIHYSFNESNSFSRYVFIDFFISL